MTRDIDRRSDPFREGRWRCALMGWVFVTVTACSFGDVDLGGRGCPCLVGWECSPAGICVPTEDATSRDGGADASARDARSDDANSDAGGRDAGSRDAGPEDAGSTDAGSDAGGLPSSCDSLLSGALFCDGFERADLFPWGISPMAGSAAAQSTATRYREAGALRTDIFTGGSNTDVFLSTLGGITSGTLYARGYFYLPSGSDFDFVVFLAFGEGFAPFGSINLVFVEGPRVALQTFSTPADSEYERAPPLLPTDRWFCIQLSIVVADTGGRADLAIDGTVVATIPNARTAPATGFRDFVVGATFTDPGQGPVHFFADEVAFGRDPLPCDP